jgi:hypothetical protein
MRQLAQLVLLLALSQCVHSSLHTQQHEEQTELSSLELSYAPAFNLRGLLQDSDTAAADLQLMATTSSSNVFAAQAGSTCRISQQNRATLTVRCHSSCHVCNRVSGTTLPNRRQCRCCKPGFFLAAGANSPSCTPCPQGQFGPLFGQTACRKCPRNMVSLAAGSRVCDGESAGRQADTLHCFG